MIATNTPGIPVWVWIADVVPGLGAPKEFKMATGVKKHNSTFCRVEGKIDIPRRAAFHTEYECWDAKIEEMRAKGLDVAGLMVRRERTWATALALAVKALQ